MSIDFASTFHALTGFQPFKWQHRLFAEFARGDIPDACDIPTGLGKTSVIAIWLAALDLRGPGIRLPRRLIYVVDRRAVVDNYRSRGLGRCARRWAGPRSDHCIPPRVSSPGKGPATADFHIAWSTRGQSRLARRPIIAGNRRRYGGHDRLAPAFPRLRRVAAHAPHACCIAWCR